MKLTAANRLAAAGLSLLLATTLPAVAQDASVYKWVDAEGVPHYSDQPPADAAAQELNIRFRRTDRSMAQNQAKPKTAAGESVPAPTTESSSAESASAEEAERQQVLAERKATCEKAKERVAKYSNARRLYKPGPDGERIYLSDEEIDAERAEANRAVKEWCDEP